MKIRSKSTWVALVTALGIAAPAAYAEDTQLADALRKLMEENTAAYDREDVDAVLSSVATKSPEYDTTKAELAAQFGELEVKPELVRFDYIGHDDEFALARVRIRTVGTPKSEDFADNTMDAIAIFHQQDGVWKLWSQYVLGVEFTP